jgi:hypothetical protein
VAQSTTPAMSDPNRDGSPIRGILIALPLGLLLWILLILVLSL